MKKKLLAVLAFLILVSLSNIAYAKSASSNSTIANAIRQYKAKNYTQSYLTLSEYVKKDPSNPVAFYYLAMNSAQLGKRDEAIANYNKVLSLSPSGQVEYYALKGKTCLEYPDKCNEPASKESELDNFIRGRFGSGFSNEARSIHEKQKIDNLMREINRDDEISPQKFKEYKDFSSQAKPTDEEVVAALRTLQKAGFGDIINHNNISSDLSLLTGRRDSYNGSEYDMLYMLLGKNSGEAKLSPQVIQSLLSNQMTAGF